MLPFIQGGRKGRALRDTGTFKGPPRQNARAHASASQRPHFGRLLHTPHSQWICPAGLLGITLTRGQAPRGPSEGAWCCNAGHWGPPNLSAGLTLLPLCHPGLEWRHRSFREEQAGPSEPPATFEGPTRQNTWAHAPARQRPHLGPPLPHHTASGSGLPASWGLTLTLGRPRVDPPRWPGAAKPGISNPRAPVPH